MPVFLLPLVKEAFGFFSSKTGMIVMGVIALAIAVPVEILHFENVGAAKELAKERVATMAETQRRLDVEAYWKTWAEGATAQIDAKERTDVQTAAAPPPAATDHSPCLDRGDAGWLRALGRGRQAGDGAGKPSRKATRH